jgi:hypothetical protein
MTTNSTSLPAVVADGDLLCFKVVSDSGEATLIYKIEIWIGRNANLTSVKIGTAAAFTTLGTPAATWNGNSLVQAEFLGQEPVPPAGLSVLITPADSDAEIQYAYQVTDTAEPSFAVVPNPLIIPFQAEGYLYIKVTSGNGNVILIYKIFAQMMQSALIYYGIPKIGDNDIDDIWDTVEESYEIRRLFPSDTTNPTWAANPDTFGVAKALWDDEGLYVFWDITDPSVVKQGTTSGNQWLHDSIELFINEAYLSSTGSPATGNTYTTGGSQYRVSRDGVTSGDPSAAVSALNSL